MDQWVPEARAFERWFSAPLKSGGTITSVQFKAPRDVELLTTEKPGIYSLSLLHVGSVASETFLRHLWTVDIGDTTSAAHLISPGRWFLPTSSGGAVVAEGRIQCSVATDYSQGPPASSAMARGHGVVVAGHHLWRYRPICGGSADAGHRHVALTLRSIAAIQKGWVAIGIDEARSAMYFVDENLEFASKVDLSVRDEEVDLASNLNGAVVSVPSLGIAYANEGGHFRKMTIGRGFTACRSWSGAPLLFSDGVTVRVPTLIASDDPVDLSEVTLGQTTFVPTTHDLWGRALVLLALVGSVLGIASYYRRKRGAQVV